VKKFDHDMKDERVSRISKELDDVPRRFGSGSALHLIGIGSGSGLSLSGIGYSGSVLSRCRCY
jgi:hypothetical protein